MAITYPLLMPAQGIRSITIRSRSVVARSTSPFTLQQQIQAHAGQCWEADVEFPPMKQDGYADAIAAFLTGLNGIEGTFFLGDSARKLPRGTQALVEAQNINSRFGPLVSGASQTGSTLVTARWPANVLCFSPGDYIQLGGGNMLLRSNAFDHATWSKSNVTITANASAGPDGLDASGADQVVVGGSGDAYIEQSFVPSANGDIHTFSVWLKTSSGTASIDIALQSPSGAYMTTTAAVTTNWRRFWISSPVSSSNFNPVAILGRTTPLPNGVTFFAWGAQVNLGATPDPYIGTTSAISVKTPRLHKVISSAHSNSGGVCNVNIWPRLRSSPADGEFIKVANCVGTFRLAGNEAGWSVDPAKIYSVGFSAVEAI